KLNRKHFLGEADGVADTYTPCHFENLHFHSVPANSNYFGLELLVAEVNVSNLVERNVPVNFNTHHVPVDANYLTSCFAHLYILHTAVRILIRLGNTTRNSLVLPGEASLSCRKGERREALQNLQFEVVGLHSL